MADDALILKSDGSNRQVVQYDAINDQVEMGTAAVSDDSSGHGSHITSIIANSDTDAEGDSAGVAPDVNIVSIKAFNTDGSGSYLDVIRGLEWALANKNTYNIRVLNLSFSATPQSYYWDDPLNQAVMRLWQEGIVVVAAAGNTGPDPMTIGVPGNVPYIITVGAISDNYTPMDSTDDRLATFSAAGPTIEGFVKPDIVAPGGHVLGLMPLNAEIALRYPQYRQSDSYFTMSGTSQATAMTSGIVALMLQAEPTLTPNDVKCRLMASANLAQNEAGLPAYSVFQQGAGLVNAYDAAHSSATGCANQGLDIAADLAGTAHFQGQANQDADGNYFIIDQSGFAWSGGTFWAGGFAWSGGTFWAGGFAWSGGTFWAGGLAWSSNYVWDSSFAWSGAQMAVNQWVPQE